MELPIRILITDDDDVCRRLIRDAIEEEGVEVDLAGDGTEALAQLQKTPADMLITDLHMPRMDGLTLLTRARQLLPHILSIIITGYGSLESAVEAIRQGAYDYVQKPFTMERIGVVTRNAIEMIRVSREKALLLNELEGAYRKLQILERRGANDDASAHEITKEERSRQSFCLYSQQSLPLYYYELPKDPAAGILSRLERLAELRREGTVNEKEFSVLKKAIINSAGTSHS
ncbi:MAG: response regulator [Syntrophobacteraceae bacterium]